MGECRKERTRTCGCSRRLQGLSNSDFLPVLIMASINVMGGGVLRYVCSVAYHCICWLVSGDPAINDIDFYHSNFLFKISVERKHFVVVVSSITVKL